MKSRTKRIISTLAICGALILEAGATAIGSLGKALNNIAKVDAADTYTSVYLNNCPKSTSNSSYASNYNATINNIEWNAPGNQYADGAWRVGGKVKDTYNRIFYTKTKIEADVSKIEFVLGTSSLKSLNSLVLDVYSTADAAASGGTTNRISSITKSSVSASSTIEFLHPSSDSKWENAFYRFTFNVTGSSTSTQYVLLNKIEFFKKNASTGYSLSFDANGGSGSQEELTSETSGTFTLPATTTFNAPEGKAFDGWGTGTASSTKITTSQWTIPESGKTATLYALWKDVSYTDLPAGTYPIKIDYSGVAAGDTVPSSIYYTIKEDSGSTYYKKAKVEYTGVTASYANEYSWKASSHKMTFSSNSNATVTKLSVKYYKANDLTVKNAAGTTITGTSIESVTNYNIKEYNINSTGFTLNGPSSGTMSVYEMTATLVVEDDSSVTDVINEINALPTAAYTQEFADKLNSALDHYSKLSASDQALVTNHNKLLTAQSSFNELRDAAVANVESLITQIGTVTADSGAKISDARNAYDALLADTLGKSLVSNYSTLTAAEATYQDAQAVKAVEDLINALPDATSIDDYSHHNDIATARAAYEALSGTQKGMVSAALVTKLEACENAEKPFAPKEATFYYGGTTTGSFEKDTNAAKTILHADDSQWSVIGYADKANIPGYNKDGTFRLYYNASGSSYFIIKILIADAKITNITLNFNSSSPTTNVVVTDSKGSTISGSSNVYAINDTEVKIKNGASSNQQVWFDSIVCAYSIPTSSTITYNGLEGVDNSNNPTSYVEGTGCTIAAPKGTREGYTFIGWFDNPSYSGSAVTSISAGKTGNITLYAKWQIKSHTYKIVYDNGTADATDTLNYGTTITIPAAPSKTGYEFLNWSDGTNTYNPGATVSMPDKDFTITAKYNVEKYTITFYKAVGEVFTTYTNKEYLSEIDLPSPAPTKEGFTFVGWAEDSSATEASWATGKYQVPAKNVDFYAVFTNAPAITGVTLANTFTSIELTEANNSFSATAEVSITPHSLDTTIDWSVSPTDAGTLTNTSTNSGVSPIFTASKLYDEVTITATSHGDDNYYKTFTFAIVNPVDEYVSDIVINEGSGVRKAYYSSETAVDMTGLTADATYKSTARPLYEDTRDVTSSATWTLDIANKKVIASLGGKTDYIAIEVIDDAITEISVDDNTGKREYTIGDEFDYSEVTVTGSYNNPALADEDVTSDCVFDDSAFDSLHEGTYTIIVSYKGSETIVDSYTVEVKKTTVSEAGWKLVTSNTDLSAGSKYLIVGIKESNYYGIQAYSSGNNIKGSAVNSPDENNFIAYDNTKGNAEITLGGSAGNWTLFDGSLYLYAAGGTGKNNYLKGAENADNANAQWSIDVAADGKATIKTADTTVARHTMRFNTNGSNDPLFSCYESGQSDIYLYKYIAGSSAKIVGVDAAYTGKTTEGTVINNTDSTITFNTITNTGISSEIKDPGNVTLNGGDSVTLAVGLNEIELSYTTGGKTYNGILKVNATAVTKYDLSVSIDTDEAEYSVSPTITDNKLVEGGDYTIEVSAKEGYVIESVTATGATVSGNTVTITNASSDVSITVSSRALAMYGITDSTDTYATLSNTATQVKEGTTYESDVTFATGKELDTVSVTMGGVEVTGAYSNGHIKVENVSGDLVISITSKDVYFDVEYNFNHVSGVAISPETSLPEKVVYNGSVSFKVEPESGYAVDAGHIMVKEDGAAKTFSYDSTTGILTVSNVTNALEIAIDAFKLADVTKDLGDGLSISHESSPVSINSSYTLELSLEDGKEITSVSVKMGGEPVDDAWNASTLTVYIPTVTDDIEIKIETQTIQVPINANGNLVVSPEASNYGSEGVTVTVSAKEGYVISGDLYYTIGDDDTQYPISGNSFTVDSLTQEINVYGETKEVYNIDFDLTDVTYSPNQDYILKDADSYVLVLSIADDPSMYEIDMDSFKIEMNGHDITDYAGILEYSYNETTGILTITFDVENLTDDIKVTAAQQLKHFNVNVDGDDDFVTLSGDTVIVYGETGSVILTPDDHYHFVEGGVIVKDSGSADVTLTKQDDGSVKIEFTSAVTGKINITVEVEHDTVSITAPEAGLENLTVDFQGKDVTDISYDPNTPIAIVIYAKTGFILPGEDGITVTCYGEVLVSGEDYFYQPENNLLIVYAIGDIEISGTASKGKSNVTVAGDEHVSFNGGEGLPEKTDTGLSFTATVEAEEGYRIDSIVVTMNGSVVKNAYVAETGTITVQNVTRDITITVVTVKLETISYDVENVTLSNTSEVVDNNSAFESTISFDAGYELTTVKVMMGGNDITNTAYASGVISIEHVTGAVEITVKASKISYDVTNTLTDVTNSNNAANIEYGAAYEATISVNEGYENLIVKVEMGGVDVTASVYNDGVISIDSVTGELKITASATAKAGFNVTSSHDNATLTGSADGAYGYLDNYSVTVAANEGYNLTSIVVLVDGVAHPEFVNGNIVTISKISGEVTVTVTCAGKPQELIIDIENVSLPGLPENIKYGDSINAEVEPEVGYSISSVKVYEDGVEKPEYVIYHPATKAHGSEAWYEIVIPEVKGSIKIEVESAPIDFSVDTTGLVNVVSTGADTATFDTTYTAKLTPATGFENLDDIKVYMNGVDVTSSVVFDNYIFIAKVTGAISIEATATEMEFTVSYDLTNVEIDAVAGTFKYSDVYEGNISYNEAGYTDFDIVIIVNGVDKTADYYHDGKVTITGIKGDVVISASASPKVFDVINNNWHVGNTNLDNTVHYDESYHAEFEIDLGYENLTVQVLMGGEDVTADVYSNGVIDIAKVTGQIEITAEASAKVFDVDTDLSHVELSNDQTTAAYDSEFLCEVDAVEGYENVVITVLMDGEDVTDFVYENGVIFIEKVTGKIEITASASAKHFTVTYDLENVTSSSSVVYVAYDEAYSATLTVNEGYFDLQVTVTMNGSPVEVVNGVITIDKVTGPIVITASATKIELVSITAEPTTLEVDFDTTINPSDFVVTGHYNDGSDKVIDAESISGYDPHLVGEQTVTVNAGGKTFNVTVNVKVSEVIDHIEASTEKTTVDYGDSFTKEDVKVTYVYTDGHRVEGQPAESVTGFNTHVIGEQTLTVTAAGKETTLVINVNGHVIVSISAVGYDEYVDQGKDYVFNGIVSANYADGTSSVVTEGYEVSKVDTSGHGPQTAKVTYQGFSAEVTVNVIQTKTLVEPYQTTAIIGGAVVGVAIISAGIFFFLKKFKL